MIFKIKQKLLTNANEFRYMYFGILFTVLMVLLYKFMIEIKETIRSNLSLKQKVFKILKSKYLIGIIIAIVPILLEIILYNNTRINFSKEVYMRFLYEYGFFAMIAIYKYLCHKSEKINKVLDFCIKHRYKIAIIVFIVLVALKVNFSSLDMWNYYIRENVGSTIFGEARSIRADEWLVTTPINLSQEYDGYNRVNENFDIGNNDMNILHAPVLDASIVVRIFSWGYILFGNEVGLSWMWCLKLIVMLMVFFEFGMMITKKDKGLSLLAAIWLTFSPAIMWWSMLEVFSFAMAIVVLFNTYVSNPEFSIKKKFLIAYGMILALCNFAYVLYPAWQIPLAYFIAMFVIIDFIKYRKNLKKKDYIIMVVTILLVCFFIGYFIITSWDGIQAMLNTKYPGGREELGGDYSLKNLAKYYTNFFTPYSDDYENPCESASFIFPTFGILVCGIWYLVKSIKSGGIKEKIKNKDNWYLYGAIGITAILFLWLTVQWPKILAKITLLYTSPTKRTALVFQFGCVLITIMLASRLFKREKKLINNKVAFVISILISILTYIIAKQSQYAATFTTFKLSVLISIIFFKNYTLLSGNKKGFIFTMILISLITSAYVNPITIGTDAITDTKIAKAAVEISNNDPEAIWIGQGQLNSQYLVGNGIKVLNGINEFPNYDWIDKLDSKHEYEEVWNRYAHIIIKLDYSTYFELNLQDAYTVHMTYDDLKTLNIKYYYTNEKVNEKMMDDFNMEMVYGDDEAIHYIYVIN